MVKLKSFHYLMLLVLLVGWTLVIAGFLSWDLRLARSHMEELALKEARSNFNKDLAFRLWATRHGGVYVPTDERTPPNPGLAHLPERDIVTPSGVPLTLMNPAYMLRQLLEEYGFFYGVRGRITSFKPINPINAPDPWESEALRRFEQGAEEYLEFQHEGGEPRLRLMRPMVTEQGCLKCHAFQGYQVGDVRGGIGVIVSMRPYLETLGNTQRKRAIFFGVIWLLGMAVIFFLERQVLQRIRAQETHEEILREKSLALERANADLTRLAEVSAHHLMEPSRRIVTYSGIIRRHLVGKEGDQELDKALEFVDENASYLRNLVRDIQFYLAAGELRGELVQQDMVEVSQRVWQRLSRLVKESGGQLLVDDALPPAYCDLPRLMDLLRVLLENALVHRRPELPPKVYLSGERQGRFNCYRVSDNGLGLPGAYRERVLEIFERVNYANRDAEKGTGIGLAIARRIVESLGGEISLETSGAGGLTVVFTLPAIPHEPTAS